jgi:dihydrofolate synthase/folylpolyglutamate synthase
VVNDHSTLVVPSDLHPDALEVVKAVVAERHARLVTGPVSDGSFQRRNFTLSYVAAAEFLGRPPEPSAVEAAVRETRIPGRLDVVGDRPLVVHDGAHNPAGAEALAAALPEVLGERRPAVMVASVLDDKDAAGMLGALLPLFDHAVYTRCANPRALSPATLETLAAKLGGSLSETVGEPRAALERAREIAGPHGAVVATGSIYLIADLVRGEGRERASSL